MQDMLQPPMTAELNGLVGDCIGSSDCYVSYPPGKSGPAGFYNRISKLFPNDTLNTAPHYDWVIIHAGVRDVANKCQDGNSKPYDNTPQEIIKITDYLMNNTKSIIYLLLAYQGPLFKGTGQCANFWEPYRTNFMDTANEMQSKYKGRVYANESTNFILGNSDNYFYDGMFIIYTSLN